MGSILIHIPSSSLKPQEPYDIWKFLFLSGLAGKLCKMFTKCGNPVTPRNIIPLKENFSVILLQVCFLIFSLKKSRLINSEFNKVAKGKRSSK